MKHALKVTFVFLFFQSLVFLPSYGQDHDKLEYEADVLEGGKKDGVGYQKLIGNVKITQKNTIIHCDTALVFENTNSMEAFGNVKIEDLEDSVIITSNTLYYDGDGRTAKLRGNVAYADDSIKLYTDNLDYDMINKSANYFNGGKIIEGTKTLESEKGNYDTEGKMMIFTDSVIMTTADYTSKSENLVYNMITKRARISGDQAITTSDGIVLQSKKGGEFDTEKGTSVFRVGEVDTDKYLLKGDELYFDNRLGSYSATGNVYLLAKEDSVIITGNNAHFWNDKGMAKVFGDPLLKKPLINDTLFLRADTLVSIDDSLSANKRLLAYNNVMIFKSDLQGKSDSLAYFLSDSSITFYQDPILWNDGSQITADTISVVLKNGTIDQLQTSVDSFIISEDSTQNYNQIKGRNMVALFKGKSIDNVNVTGNGESIYFVADEENTKTMMGMNRIICSNMKIIFLDNQVHDIRFYTNPDGKIIPPHELKDEDKKLEGFAWRIKERPTKRKILINPVEAQRIYEEEAVIFKKEEENKTKLEELIELNIDIDKIKEKLKKPVQDLQQQ